jgi:hypothetical protein
MSDTQSDTTSGMITVPTSLLGGAGEDSVTSTESDNNTEGSESENDSMSEEETVETEETSEEAAPEETVEAEETPEEKPSEEVIDQPDNDELRLEEANRRRSEINSMNAEEMEFNLRVREENIRREALEKMAVDRAVALLGGPLPQFDLDKANAVNEVSEEPEVTVEETVEQLPGAWIGYAQRVHGYLGEDNNEAWQIMCRYVPEMMKFFNHVPSNNLLEPSQIEYLETAEPAVEEVEEASESEA